MTWSLGREGTHEVVSEADRRGLPLRAVICMDTGLVRNDPVPSDAELERFYGEEYRVAYKGSARPRRRQILRNFRRATAHVRTNWDMLKAAMQVLEIGAGSGEIAFVMARRGKSVTGIEPNFHYAAYCREELGLDVRTAHLAPDLFQPGEFDLIRLSHVLEHLNDPVRYLGQNRRVAGAGRNALCRSAEYRDLLPDEIARRHVPLCPHLQFHPWTLRACAGLAGLAEAPETAQRSGGHHRRLFFAAMPKRLRAPRPKTPTTPGMCAN